MATFSFIFEGLNSFAEYSRNFKKIARVKFLDYKTVMKPIDLQKAVEVIRRGGIVLHPTETCYGFAVDIFNEDALKKLYELKGRDAAKPISILVSNLEMAKKFGLFSEKAIELAEKYWPGPLTIVVPRSENLPRFWNPGGDFVGIRCSSDDFSLGLVKGLGGPVTTTSANLSGAAPLYSADIGVFGEKAELIDCVVDSGKIAKNEPSTVVRVVGDEVEILRQGGLALC